MSLVNQSHNILRYIASLLPLNAAYNFSRCNHKLYQMIWRTPAFWKIIFLNKFGPLFQPMDENWINEYRQAHNQIEIIGRYLEFRDLNAPLSLARSIKMVGFGKNHIALLTYAGQLFMAGSNTYQQFGVTVESANRVSGNEFILIRDKVKFVDCASSCTFIIDDKDDLYITGSGRVLGLGDGIKHASSFTFLSHQVSSVKVRESGFVYIKSDNTAYFCSGCRGSETWTPQYLTRNVRSIPWIDSERVYVQTQTSNLYWIALNKPKIRHRIMRHVKSVAATMYRLLVITRDHNLVSIKADLIIDNVNLDHKIKGWIYGAYTVTNVKFVACNNDYHAYIDFDNNLFIRRLRDKSTSQLKLTESHKFELFDTNVTSLQFYSMNLVGDGCCITKLVDYSC